MTDRDGYHAQTTYSDFHLADNVTYAFAIGENLTNRGISEAGDGVSFLDGAAFSAVDADTDGLPGVHCAQLHQAAGWFYQIDATKCLETNIFGAKNDVINQRLTWFPFRNDRMTLKTIKWSVRPPNFDGERSEMLIRVFVVSRSSSVLVRSSVKTGGFVPNSFEHLC